MFTTVMAPNKYFTKIEEYCIYLFTDTMMEISSLEREHRSKYLTDFFLYVYFLLNSSTQILFNPWITCFFSAEKAVV